MLELQKNILLIKKYIYEIKHFFSIVLVACITIAACSAEFEHEQLIPTERVENLKSKILQLAEEHELPITVNEKKLLENIDDVNLDTIEAEMINLASIKGNYIISKNKNDGKYKMSKQKMRSTATRRAAAIRYERHMTTEIIRGNRFLYGHCIIDWTFDGTEHIGNGSVYPFISHDPWAESPTDSDCDIFVYGNGYCVMFSGSVKYSPSFYYTTFYVSGQFTATGGTINWQ